MKQGKCILGLLFFMLVFSSCQKEKISTNSSVLVEVNNENIMPVAKGKSCQITPNSYPLPTTFLLIAGQNYEAGVANITSGDVNGEPNLFVEIDYSATEWLVGQVDIYAGSSADIPFNGGCRPQIGQFPYGGDAGLSQTVTYSMPLSELSSNEGPNGETCYIILIHVVSHLPSGRTKQDWVSAFNLPVNLNGKGGGGNSPTYNQVCL